jgi:hypothetical protein
LKDLRPGGTGWKKLPYNENMEIYVPSGEYIVFPEYDSSDIGMAIPRQATPITGGGGKG